MVDPRTIERVLMVRLSAIGDVVHTLPVAPALKRSFPHLHVAWAVEDRCVPIVGMNPYVDEVVTIPRHRWRAARWKPATWAEGIQLLRDVRSRHFDLALDLQGLMKSAIIARLSGARERLGYHWQREGARFLVKAVPARPTSTHVVDQYLDVVRALGANAEPIDFGIVLPDEARDAARRLLAGAGVSGSYAVINPSAGAPEKRWPPERFAAIIDLLEERGLPAVLVGHTADVPIEQAIASHAKRDTRSLVGLTDLRELSAVLAGARVHLCGDTGSAHIAAALKVPVISLYGSTDPERSGPYGQLSNAISRYGQEPLKTAVAAIKVSEVWERLEPYTSEAYERV